MIHSVKYTPNTYQHYIYIYIHTYLSCYQRNRPAGRNILRAHTKTCEPQVSALILSHHQVVEERATENVSILLAVGETGIRLLLENPGNTQSPLIIQDHFESV